MTVAEGSSGSIRYKSYATGVISSNSQPVSTVDPAITGGQILRRVSSSLKLAKDTYQSAEIRADKQIADFRHGVKRVTGSLTGEFSPATYFDFLEAACRATKTAAITGSPTDFTSVSASNVGSSFTFAGGNPVTKGYRIGDIWRFTGMSDTDNNTKNFLITGFGGTQNRIVSVYPAPDTQTVDTSFTVATVGKTVFTPSSGFVSRKFGIEVNNSDIDISRLFTECRVGGVTIGLPATGMSTIEFPMMGRDMEVYSAGSAPFFTAPAAATSTGIFAAVNGLLRVGGSVVGVVTGLNVQMNLNPTSDAVVGQNFVPEVFLGRANVTGQVTAMFQDSTLISDFKNESEIDILAYLTTTSDVNSPAASIYLPRVKFGDAAVADSGEGSQSLTMPFQALLYGGSAAGVELTTIRFADTEAV
jgi:hypothetical protein